MRAPYLPEGRQLAANTHVRTSMATVCLSAVILTLKLTSFQIFSAEMLTEALTRRAVSVGPRQQQHRHDGECLILQEALCGGVGLFVATE